MAIALRTSFIDFLKTLLSYSSGNVLGISRPISYTFFEIVLVSFSQLISIWRCSMCLLRGISFIQTTFLSEGGTPFRVRERRSSGSLWRPRVSISLHFQILALFFFAADIQSVQYNLKFVRDKLLISYKFIIATMEISQKERFTVEIRRKQIQNKIQNMRSLYFSETNLQLSNENELIQSISSGKINILDKLYELKVMSYKPQHTQMLLQFGVLDQIFNALNEPLSDIHFNDMINVLINMTGYCVFEIPNNIMAMIITNFLNTKRQISCLWLTANIIYQKTQYSNIVVNELMNKCECLQFMENRLAKKFDREEDIVIFNFFCCSFLTVSFNLSSEHFLRLLKVIETLTGIQGLKQENLWYMSQALVEHGNWIGENAYQIFGSELFNVFHDFCQKKKTKFIKNYLKTLINFTSNDQKAYDKMLKYEVFTDLSYCLENRFPEIKKLCAQIGINLLSKHREKVDIQNIYFFQELSTEFVNFEKYDISIQAKLLEYSRLYFDYFVESLIGNSSKEAFIDGLYNTQVMESLCLLITTNSGSSEVLLASIGIVQILIKIDKHKKIIEKCQQSNICHTLSITSFKSQEVYKVVEKFISLIEKR